jgi:phage shock protein PspC (stress-responsive transcriptional regulator)
MTNLKLNYKLNRKSNLELLFVVALYFISSICLATEEDPAESQATLSSNDYVSISIDKVVVDTLGLTQMTHQLAKSIKSLSHSIEQLSANDTLLDKQDRQALVAATLSVNNASQALTNLSQQLPLAIERLTRELPDALKNTQPQITAISNSIKSASDAVIQLNDSFPASLSKVKLAISEITESVMQQVTLFVGLILFIFAFVLAVIMYIVYKTSIQPIANGLNELRAVPEQLSDMSAYMHNTSENLLNLEQQQKIRKRRSHIGRLK